MDVQPTDLAGPACRMVADGQRKLAHCQDNSKMDADEQSVICGKLASIFSGFESNRELLRAHEADVGKNF